MIRLTVSLLVVMLLQLAGCGPSERQMSGSSNFHARDSERVYAHLTRVEADLRGRDTDHLSRDQRAGRARALDWLREYRKGRTYPHNHVLPGRRTPVFVDGHQTPCAVGYLLLRSGERELVRDVVENANLARVPELADDPRLEDWLNRNGLTVEEATRIQPAYNGDAVAVTNPVNYETGSVALAVGSGALVLYDAFSDAPDRGLGLLNVLTLDAGATHGALAVKSVVDDEDQAGWAVGLNQIAALASLVSGWPGGGEDEAREARRGRFDVDPIARVGSQRTVLGVRLRH